MDRHIRLGTLLAIILVGVLFSAGSVLADATASREVTVTYDAGGDSLITPDFLPCHNGEQLTVINGTGQEIDVDFNVSGTPTTLADAESVAFDCTDEPEDCYEATMTGGGGKIYRSAGCTTGGSEIPTLSEWGLIIFALLIMTSATVVMTRRKRATAAA
jgi:hypothetical protein